MTITERATVAVFGVALASVFGVLLAWIVMAVAVGTDDKGKAAPAEKKTGAPAEKIEILKARPRPITAPWAHFMPIDRDGRREGYWTDPETGEQVKILPSRPIHSIPTTTPNHFMRIGETIRIGGSKAVAAAIETSGCWLQNLG
jgi:hypothetical protein